MEEAMKLMTKFINSGLDPMFFIKESFTIKILLTLLDPFFPFNL